MLRGFCLACFTLQRGAESQVPGEGPEQQQGNGSSEAGDSQPAKKPALSSSFSFRPSPLHKATQGLILRQSSLTPPSSIPGTLYSHTLHLCYIYAVVYNTHPLHFNIATCKSRSNNFKCVYTVSFCLANTCGITVYSIHTVYAYYSLFTNLYIYLHT